MARGCSCLRKSFCPVKPFDVGEAQFDRLEREPGATGSGQTIGDVNPKRLGVAKPALHGRLALAHHGFDDRS